MKIKLFLILYLFLPLITLAQFVDTPEITSPENTPAIKNNINIFSVFDVLILLSALLFIISLFGFTIGGLKLITAGGNEVTAEKSRAMLVTSGWIFIAAVVGYLLVNIVKYFIY